MIALKLEGKDRRRPDVAAELGITWIALNKVMVGTAGRYTVAKVIAWAEKNPLVLSKLQNIK